MVRPPSHIRDLVTLQCEDAGGRVYEAVVAENGRWHNLREQAIRQRATEARRRAVEGVQAS